jgi:UDP-N-acetylglucosamine 2-epimerase (non-hydrolysing)
MVANRPLLSLVAGARPNFMKIAPILRELEKREDTFRYELVHTGQHYDREMSDVFFDELGIPAPDLHLGAGGGSHSEQTGKIMLGFERYIEENEPDAIIVVGDVNSTLACSIVAKKMLVKVAHVEAGLRSGDMTMPEEINRIVTDAISDWFFVTETSGVDNLLREGKTDDQIFFVGHVMIDNLYFELDKLEARTVATSSDSLRRGLERYGVVTLHRPANVDDEPTLKGILEALGEISERLPLIFPVHPRTRKRMDEFGIQPSSGVVLTEPLSYLNFLNLWKDADLVLTDSGGLQEETTALSIPCITLRENTERPVTLTHGSNRLAGVNPDKIIELASSVLSNPQGSYPIPALWDGNAAVRIVNELDHRLNGAGN